MAALLMAEPYLHIRKVGGRVEVAGQHTYAVGHKIDPASDGVPDGIFAEWSWDGVQLTVRNDRYGFHPLLYFEREGEICVSPSLFTLLARGAPAELDDAGLAVFLRLGYFVGDDTPLRAVRALPPGAVLEWRDGACRRSGGYWFVPPDRPARDDAIDAYVSLFRAAVHKRLPRNGDFVVPLSGGRDSRHLLLELCKLGCQPESCVTVRGYSAGQDADVEVARLVAKAVGLPHIVLEQQQSWFQAEVRKNLATNLCADEHAWFLVFADYVSGTTDTVYDGIGGDVFTGSAVSETQRVELEEWARLFEAGRFGALADAMLYQVGPALGPLLTREARARMSREVAIVHLADELRKHTPAANPLASFWFWNRTRREIALSPYALLRTVPRVYSPYVDHDLYKFLASLPAELAWREDFHTATIRRGHPRYADVPYTDDSPPARDATDHLASFGRELARFAFTNRPRRAIRSAYVMPLLVGCLMSRSITLVAHWFLPRVLYLLQLESAGRPVADSELSGVCLAG
jgi:asparagine synthase (glutamine-hydrolysing)